MIKLLAISPKTHLDQETRHHEQDDAASSGYVLSVE